LFHGVIQSVDLCSEIKEITIDCSLITAVGEMRNVYRILDGKQFVKWSHRGLRRRWKDNIKINLKEIGFEGGR
jgi:hypothetical protein